MSDIENNKEVPKFEVGDHVAISKLKRFRKLLPWIYNISNLNGEETVGMFYELQKANYKKFRVENITKAKVSKIYVKWKGHNNSFKNCIDKKSRMGMESNSLCKQKTKKKTKKQKLT